MHPLPHLCAGNLGGGGVLHQVVNRHAAVAAQPRFQILNADVDVCSQALVGNLALGNVEQVGSRHLHILAFHVNLIGRLHVLVEDFLGDRDQARVRYPGAVVAGFHFAKLILTHFFHRRGVCRSIIFNRNLRRHAAHRMDLTTMARLDQQVHIGLQEMFVHGDRHAIRHHEFRMILERLDEAKDIIPAAAVQTRGMIAQLPQDFVHLKRGENRLDQHGRADGPIGNAQRPLRMDEYVIPQTCFQMALDLRQVEVRSRSLRHSRLDVVEEIQPEVE